MIKVYKDTIISYFMVALTGMMALWKLANITKLNNIIFVLLLVIIPLYAIACVLFYNNIATKRFKKITTEILNTCQTQKGLNFLFGLRKGKVNNPVDLVVTMHIVNYLRVYGKNTFALNLLLQYDAEKLFKANRFIAHKFIYYSNLAACYYRLGKKEEAQKAYNIADELYNRSNFPQKAKETCKTTHQLNRLIILGDGEKDDQLLALLSTQIADKKDLLSQVQANFYIASILFKRGETEKIKEHIEFVRENGGDTVFARCALANNFSDEFLKKIDAEPYEPEPIKIKYHKVLILSVAVTILIIALAVLILAL